MKQPIKPEDIRKGDLIREERTEDCNVLYSAVEYRATEDKEVIFRWSRSYFLLDRPFKPYWGMVIVNPQNAEKAIYLPGDQHDDIPWVSTVDREYNEDWYSNDWAKQRLAEGWAVITPPQGEEGVK